MKNIYVILSQQDVKLIDAFRAVSGETRAQWVSCFLEEAVSGYPLPKG